MRKHLTPFLSIAALAAVGVLLVGSPTQAQDPSEAESTETEAPAYNPTPAVDTSVMELGNTPSSEAIPLTPTLVSVSEIQSQIGLPASARLKEYEEDLNNPKAALSSDEIKKIFSDKPRFIYFPEGVDPMIIPWVRDQIIAEELAAEANVALAAKDFDRAEARWTEIREKYPNTTQGQEAPRQVAAVQTAREKELTTKTDLANMTKNAMPDGTVSPPNEVVIELPQWIRQNTTGVLIEDAGMLAVVGDDFLKVGEAVPRFSGVVVKTISASEVTFSYQDKEFVQEVVGTF